MQERKCSCNRFQIDQLPCPHALAILKQMNQDPYKYCSNFYTKETLLATYEETVHPIPNQTTWNIPIQEQQIKVQPPEGRIKAGRPKKRRIKAQWAYTRHNKCGRCAQLGHNRKTCRNAPINK